MIYLNRIINKLKATFSGDFAKGVLTISSGTVIAQSLGIVLSPIITRLYSPTEYGILTVFTAVLVFLSIGTLNYELGLPITKAVKKSINLVVLSILVLIFYTLFLFFILMFFGNDLLEIFDASSLAPYKYYLPVGVFFTGLFNIFRQWSFRIKNYKSISKANISQYAIGNSSKVVFGLLGFGSIGLVIGRILTKGFGFVTLFSTFLKDQKGFLKEINFSDIKWNFFRYKDFPLYRTPTVFIQRFGVQLPVLFMTSLYGVTVAGWYGLANTIVMLPMNIIGDSISDVFFGESASIGKNNPDRIQELSRKLLLRIIIIGFIPAFFMIIFVPSVFEIIFGSDWYVTGQYARILSFSMYMRMIFVPVSRIYEVFERQRTKLIINSFQLTAIAIGFFISWYFNLNSYFALIIYAIICSIFYVIDFYVAQTILKNKSKQIKSMERSNKLWEA